MVPRPRLALPLALAVALSLLAPAAATAHTTDPDAPRRVLVGPAPGRAVASAVASVDGVVASRTLSRTGVTVVELAPGRSATRVAERLAARGEVAWAEPDARVHLDGLAELVDDTHRELQWGLDNTGQAVGSLVGVAGIDVDVETAWARTRGSRDVLVAVVDTGVDVAHPDLAANVWRNPGEVAGNGVDDDGNGLVDDVTGWDFLHDDASVHDATDGEEHGTHVAGTIAAVADNGRGVAGVAPNVRVLPLKFIGADGAGWLSDAVAALDYAGTVGADVVNLSWGGPSGSQALADAITRLDAIVVAAAGNAGQDIDASPSYPASYGHDHLVSVAAVDATGSLPTWSNRGQQSVDVGAPGVAVLSTVPGGYARLSGTSMATPHVSGAAALARSVAPSASPATVAAAIATTAQPLRSLSTTTVSGGMVDAGALLAHLAPAEPAAEEDPDPATTTAPPPTDATSSDDTTTETAPAPSPAPDPEPSPSVTRLSGDDRYATGAAITATAFPDAVEEVYVATGASFADALSGAAAAGARGAPVLLVAPDHVPVPVRDQLRRLRPERVWVLGGPAVVPGAVVDELAHTTGATVRRLSGPDRYATSATISSHAFGQDVPVAYLATGTSFPDALAAGAAAGRGGGPVLLTDPSTLPTAVAAELARLRPDRVVVLGGTAAVSDTVRHAAGDAAGAPTSRIGGASRYETAAGLVAEAFPSVTRTVLLATGETFPDALGGGAAAAVLGGAVVLVPPSGPLPDAVATELARLRPTRVLALGGTGALSTETLDRVTALLS